MFKLIEGKGYRGYYTNAFTSLDDMVATREVLVEKARAAGVKVDIVPPANRGPGPATRGLNGTRGKV